MNRLEDLQEELYLLNEREALIKEMIALEESKTIDKIVKNIMSDINALRIEQSLTLLKTKKTPATINLAGYDFKLQESRPNYYVSLNETFNCSVSYSATNKIYQINIEPKLKSGFIGDHAGISTYHWAKYRFPLETEKLK